MTRPFDLNLLPVLVKIYEHGSVSAAANHLGMSQSAISGALAKLRTLYGDPLFHRVGHGMQPTARMHALIGPLQDSLRRMEDTLRTEAFDPAKTTDTFTIAMSDVGEMVFMPKILERIRKHAPGASLRSVARSAAHIERGLANGEIDLAVGFFPDLRDKAFMEQHLFYHHFVCLMRANHPLGGSKLTMAKFLEAEHAVVAGAGRTVEIFEQFLKSRRIQRRVVLETPHFMSIPFVIAHSDLIVTVPHAVGLYAKSVQLNIQTAEPPMRTPRIDLKMHWHRNFQRDPKSRWIRAIIASTFTDELDEWRAEPGPTIDSTVSPGLQSPRPAAPRCN